MKIKVANDELYAAFASGDTRITIGQLIAPQGFEEEVRVESILDEETAVFEDVVKAIAQCKLGTSYQGKCTSIVLELIGAMTLCRVRDGFLICPDITLKQDAETIIAELKQRGNSGVRVTFLGFDDLEKLIRGLDECPECWEDNGACREHYERLLGAWKELASLILGEG